MPLYIWWEVHLLFHVPAKWENPLAVGVPLLLVLFCASVIPGQRWELTVWHHQLWPILASALYASVAQSYLWLLFCINSRLHVQLKLMSTWRERCLV